MAEAADPVVIVSAARTPLGRFMDELSPLAAHKLGSHVINAVLERAKLAPEKVDEVVMGCVKRGVAALCICGGEATAIAVERLAH